MSKSIAIVETSAVSFAELKELCREIIPNVKVTQIIDESLIQEVNQNGGPTPFVKRRMFEYFRNAQELVLKKATMFPTFRCPHSRLINHSL